MTVDELPKQEMSRGKPERRRWRLGIFLGVCLLGAFALVTVFGQFRFEKGKNYFAEFANVSGLKDGDIVRIAGVEVGKVQKISVNRDATVRVEFSADDSVVLTEGIPRGDPLRRPDR